MLDLLADTSDESWSRNIAGLVADCLNVPHEVAPIIELALGQLSQCFVTHNTSQLMSGLIARQAPLIGRVSFLSIESDPPELRDLPQGFDACRASDLVHCDHEALRDLPHRLLGSTLVVPDLDTAWEIADTCPGWRFVTKFGEVVDADGTLTVGTDHAGTGLLSRKSELREAKTRLASLCDRIETLEFDLEWATERATDNDAAVGQLRDEIDVLMRQETELRTRIGRLRERRTGLYDEATHAQSELDVVAEELHRTETQLLRATNATESAAIEASTIQRVLLNLSSPFRIRNCSDLRRSAFTLRPKSHTPRFARKSMRSWSEDGAKNLKRRIASVTYRNFKIASRRPPPAFRVVATLRTAPSRIKLHCVSP